MLDGARYEVDEDHEVIEQSIVLILANNLFKKKNTSWSCEQTVLFFFSFYPLGKVKQLRPSPHLKLDLMGVV